MTLLDHAINASLVLSNVALVKQDKAGLITFAENLDAFVLADKKTDADEPDTGNTYTSSKPISWNLILKNYFLLSVTASPTAAC